MSKSNELIKLWLFEDAPEEYKKLSGHGGDEDYIVESLIDDDYDWELNKLLDRLTICDYEKHIVDENGVKKFIYITSHA